MLVMFVLVTILVYWPGLSGPLLLDDLQQIGPLMSDSGEAPATLLRNYFLSTSGPLGRPVAMISFVGDAIAHGPDTWWWKFDSLMLHLVAGLLLAWLMAELLSAGNASGTADPWMAGILVAGLWLLHPLNVSTVLYVVQRMTILSTLFVFAGLLCYVKGRLLHGRRDGPGWILIAAAFTVFMPLAVLSKESGLLFPVYCTLAEFLVLGFRGPHRVRRTLRLGHGLLVAAYAVGICLLVAHSSFVLDAYATREFTLVERVLTEFRVLAAYLTQIVLPLPGLMGFFHDDFSLSRSLLDPPSTLWSAFLVSGLVGVAWLCRKRWPLCAFGLLFFFASHGLESTVFGLEIMFEHRNYTGSPGLLLAVVLATAALARRPAILPMAAAGCAIALSALTWVRANTWSTPETMYARMYAIHPYSSRLNIVFANAYAAAGEFDAARLALDRVRPGIGRTLHALYLDCIEGKPLERDSLVPGESNGFNVIDAYATSSLNLLVDAAIRGRCGIPRDALAAVLDEVLLLPDRSSRDRQQVYFAKARLLDAAGQADLAVAAYLDAQALSDLDALPLYSAADTLARRARPGEARALLRKAATLEQASRVVRKDLAALIYAGICEWYVSAGRMQDAVETVGEARDAMPGEVPFMLREAELLLALERYEEASITLAEIDKLPAGDKLEFDYRIAYLRAGLAARHAGIEKKP